jgi:hypothetical protein
MLLDNICVRVRARVDYYPCYNKAWSIVESEFLIWANIYFWIDFWIDNSLFDWCHELSLEIWICLFDYDHMKLWYVSQNTHANKVMLIFVHIVFES